VPNRGERCRLYRNSGNGTFADVTKAAHLYRVIPTMGSNFGDFDNDGWLDMYLGTGDPDLSTLIPNRAFRNAEGKYFQDVTTSTGLGHLQKGHAVAFGDFDNDGDQDIYEVIGGAYAGDVYWNGLFENPGFGQNWITLKLEGRTSNRAAIGARLKVVVEEGGTERALFRTVGTGGSFGSNPLRQEIGLGKASVIKRIEIFWPVTKVTQIVEGLKINSFYRVLEDSREPELWNLKTFKLAKGVRHSHSAQINPKDAPSR
jgi:hypothetical protein